jgi:hypothetical protein
VRLNCYPSFFTAWAGREGARRVKTPAALVVQDKAQDLAPADNWWACYHDEVFDVAKHEGDGPCAMAFLPDEAQALNIAPLGYPCGTTIAFKPTARRLRFAFWDFVNRTNADVLAAMPKEAAAARHTLETADFTPAAYVSADPAAELAEVEAGLKSPRVREALGDKAAEADAWLAETRPILTDAAVRQSIAGQEKLGVALQKLDDFVWDLRIQQVLDF